MEIQTSSRLKHGREIFKSSGDEKELWAWDVGEQRVVSHQTAGAKPIRGVGLGGARVILIDFFFFAPAVWNYPSLSCMEW
jgi:hypothetical protein